MASSQHRDDASYSLEAGEVHLFSVAGLGGSTHASAMLLSAGGLSLVEDLTGACVLHLPPHASRAGLQLTQVQRSVPVARMPGC